MKRDAIAGPIPPGMRVWIEGAKPLTGDPYRKGEPDPGRLIVVHQWRDMQGAAAEATGCAFLWAIVAVLTGAAVGSPTVLPFWLILFMLAVVMSWVTVNSIWNRVKITVEPARIVVYHGPFSMFPNREVARSEIDELYCKRIEVEGNERAPQQFALVARLRDRAEVLIMAFVHEEPCMFAAEQITAYLERTQA